MSDRTHIDVMLLGGMIAVLVSCVGVGLEREAVVWAGAVIFGLSVVYAAWRYYTEP